MTGPPIQKSLEFWVFSDPSLSWVRLLMLSNLMAHFQMLLQHCAKGKHFSNTSVYFGSSERGSHRVALFGHTKVLHWHNCHSCVWVISPFPKQPIPWQSDSTYLQKLLPVSSRIQLKPAQENSSRKWLERPQTLRLTVASGRTDLSTPLRPALPDPMGWTLPKWGKSLSRQGIDC